MTENPLVELGDELRERGEVAAAQSAYEKCLETGSPEDAAAALIGLGILRADEFDEEAPSYFRRAFALGVGEHKQEAWDRHQDLLESGLLDGDEPDLIAFLRSTAESDDGPFRMEAKFGLASGLRNAPAFEESSAILRELVEVEDPIVSNRAKSELAYNLAEEGDPVGAMDLLRHVIAGGSDEQVHEATSYLATVATAHGDYDEAESLLGKLGAEAGGYYGERLAETWSKQGRHREAADFYLRTADEYVATEFEVLVPGLRVNAARELFLSGDVRWARSIYEQLLADPLMPEAGNLHWGPARLGLADLCAAQGEIDEAEVLYLEVLGRPLLMAGIEQAARGLIRLYAMSERHDEALRAQAHYSQRWPVLAEEKIDVADGSETPEPVDDELSAQRRLAAELIRERDRIEASWGLHEGVLPEESPPSVVSAEGVLDEIGRRVQQFKAVVSDLPVRFQALGQSIAASLESGDSGEIDNSVRAIMRSYDSMHQWAFEVRSTRVPSELTEMMARLASLIDKPVEQVRAWTDTVQRVVGEVADLPDDGSEDEDENEVSIALVLEVDSDLLARVLADMEALPTLELSAVPHMVSLDDMRNITSEISGGGATPIGRGSYGELDG